MDISRPEFCPYPFKIYPAYNLFGAEDGEFHDGFILVMRNELQDLAGGTHDVGTKEKTLQKKTVPPFKFKAWVAGPQEIRVQAPLLPWSDRGNDDEIIRRNYRVTHNRVMAALDAGRNDYIQRVGFGYETAYKIYVLNVLETEDMRILLKGMVLRQNKTKKTKQSNEPADLLKPITMNLLSNISSLDKALDTIEVPDPMKPSGKGQAYVWEVSAVPRLAWEIGNVALQRRKVGRMAEELDGSSDDDDHIAKEMAKKCNIRTG